MRRKIPATKARMHGSNNSFSELFLSLKRACSLSVKAEVMEPFQMDMNENRICGLHENVRTFDVFNISFSSENHIFAPLF